MIESILLMLLTPLIHLQQYFNCRTNKNLLLIICICQSNLERLVNRLIRFDTMIRFKSVALWFAKHKSDVEPSLGFFCYQM